MLATLTPLMLFAAAVTGLITMCLTPPVYMVRRVPPPLIVTLVTVAVAVSPLIVLMVTATR